MVHPQQPQRTGRHITKVSAPLPLPQADLVDDGGQEAVASLGFLRLLLAHTPCIVWSTDTELRFQSSLGGGLAALNLRPDELRGASLLEYWPADDPVIGAHRRALHGASVNYEATFRGRHYQAHVEPLPGSEGRPSGCLGMAFDLTDLRRAEQALRESEERFRELAKHIHQVFWTTDATANEVLYVSPAYEELWGRSCQSLYDNPHSFTDAIYPEDRQRVVDAMTQQLPREGFEEEYRIVQPDGTIRWVKDRRYPVRDPQGTIRRFVGIVEDMTIRKQSEDASSMLAAIVENSEDAIIGLSLGGTILSWNHGAERLYGYASAEVTGRHVTVLYPPDQADEWESIAGQIGRGERVPAYETTRRRKDGTLIDVSVTASLMVDRKGQIIGVSKITRDITEKKRLEEQFRQAQKMEAIGQLAGCVAHDFNNLLTIISGYSELLVSRLPANDPTRGLIQEIHKAGERAAHLTRQLLAFSRRAVVEPRVLDLNALVTDTEKMLRRLIGEDIHLTTVPDPALGRVKADAGQIEQVIVNLAVNARDAMPQGGKLTIETANVALDDTYADLHPEVKPGRYVMLAVSDTGCGMSEATKARMFEPFFTTKGPGKGTGLGLATVYGIVKQSGGHVGVYSELGHGTTFKIYLPSVKENVSSRTSLQAVLVALRGHETILLVEDEDAVRGITRLALQMHGYTVLEARNGKEALRVCDQHQGPIRLLITDVVMPEMGGRQVAERLTACQPGIRVLFLSGYTDDAVVRHGILEAEVAFLQKPFTPVALATKVREVLDALPARPASPA